MALSNGNAGYNSGPLLFLSPRNKNQDGTKAKPHFTIDRRNEAGEYVRDVETVDRVSGNLYKTEVRQKEFNGEPKKDGVIYLKDPAANDGQGESYRINVNFNIAGTDLINKLAALAEQGDFTGLTISIYENKKGYEAFGLDKDGQRVRWLYERDAIPEGLKIMHPTKGTLVKTDFTLRDEFFADVLNQIGAALGQKPATPPPEPAGEETSTLGEQEQEAAAEEQPTPTPAQAPRPVAPKPAARPAPATQAPRPAAAAPKVATPAASAPKPAPAKPAAPAPVRPTARPVAKPVQPVVPQEDAAPGDLDDGSVPF